MTGRHDRDDAVPIRAPAEGFPRRPDGGKRYRERVSFQVDVRGGVADGQPRQYYSKLDLTQSSTGF